MMAFQKPDNWQNLVDVVKSEKEYNAVVQSMESGGNFTNVHLHVLEVYTTDVCKNVDQKTAAIISKTFKELKAKYNNPWWTSIKLSLNRILTNWILC